MLNSVDLLQIKKLIRLVKFSVRLNFQFLFASRFLSYLEEKQIFVLLISI